MRSPILLIAILFGLIAMASQSGAKNKKPCTGPNCPVPRVDVRTPRVDVRVRMDHDCCKVALTDDEKEGLIEFNQYRQDHGKESLCVDPILMKIARQRARYFSHSANGQSVDQAADREGFKGFCTDNIAKGHPSSESAVQDWGKERGSVGHDKQMLGQRKMNGRWEDFDANCCAFAKHGRRYILIIGHKEA